MSHHMYQILMISGSLKLGSINTAILKGLTLLADEAMTMRFSLYEGLGELPHFNPDRDTPQAIEAVEHFREQLRSSDGVIICTPEYAAGVPGTLKNALDWIVSSGELMNKPVAAISASPSMQGGAKALESLEATLRMIDARMFSGGVVGIPQMNRNKIGPDGEVADSELRLTLLGILNALKSELEEQQES
ncbi:NAD(P)H-dependent oxidoreductase [Paenibacillus sp. YPG26]|uniref:NADPH-dependent FMN reductase n=1 Tax=Paenibacillus sp. YPG26 TaxID=2878915 RepID=UPI00203D6C58|nr:NAD(P)H-dependent oxidoreductase [Paenibacillus sp. YPG26]USB31812.1 NAD(P)H-dependent oxidoreductase [Paenibacillus sp. YPG26]